MRNEFAPIIAVDAIYEDGMLRPHQPLSPSGADRLSRETLPADHERAEGRGNCAQRTVSEERFPLWRCHRFVTDVAANAITNSATLNAGRSA